MAEQLSFDLPAIPALGREDFFVSPANQIAVATLSARPWAGHKLVLTGPQGSGKTHLTHVWTAECGARIVQASHLNEGDVLALASGPVAVEDVPRIADDSECQRALFHLHNLMMSQGQSLLMTGRAAPHLWGLSLPDLQSRVQGSLHTALLPPDDALLSAVLAKLFLDRQLSPGPDVISYLVRHLDRSFDAAAEVVDEIDRICLSEHRRITRALAVRVLNDLWESPDSSD
ncbi:MAG: DnaA/Hda family protein [Pseudomonadota bacterium]